MSGENIEVVRQVNEAFNSGDLGRILELIDPDFETLVPPAFSAEPDTYRGHEGIRRYFESFQEAMREIRFHQEDLREVGSSVVVAVRLTARGRTTGILVEQRLGQVWRVRAGKVLEVSNHASFSEALAAAGPAD